MRQSASKGLYTCTWAYSALTSTRGRKKFPCKGHLSKTPGRKVSESQDHQEGLICSQTSAQGSPGERNLRSLGRNLQMDAGKKPTEQGPVLPMSPPSNS